MSNTQDPAERAFGVPAGMEMPSCAAFLGFKLLSVDLEAGVARVAFMGREEMLNPIRNIQGGFLTAMLDAVMGSLTVAMTKGEKAPVSVDLHTQFFRAAGIEPIIGEARLRHMTKSTAFVDAALFNEAGETVANAIQTLRLLSLQPRDA